jgi:ribosomal-protein-alanine N-acetyltransferase
MIATERLILRPWRDSDAEPLAAINGDPEAMRYFFSPMSRAESDAHLARMIAHREKHGFGMWAVEAPGVADLIGIVGLQTVPDDLPCAPAVEIGWRLGRPYWRRGYAFEAAEATLEYGREQLGLPEIIAITATINAPSRALMDKLGMTYDPSADFIHPRGPADSPLKPHVVYRLTFTEENNAVR